MAECWIGHRRYRTKGAAEEAVREVLYRYSVGSLVDQAGDRQLLLDLLKMHHHAEEKIGAGVQAFAIAPPLRGKYPGFEVIRTDGSRIDFSYKKCLTPPSHRRKVLNVMRAEAESMTSDYFKSRRANDSLVSDQSGNPLDSSSTHVSYFHGRSFVDIAEEFAELVGGWDAIDVSPSAEPGLGRFQDSDLAEQWLTHFRKRAQLGLLAAQENLHRRRK